MRNDVMDIIDGKCEFDVHENFGMKCRVYRGAYSNYLVDDK